MNFIRCDKKAQKITFAASDSKESSIILNNAVEIGAFVDYLTGDHANSEMRIGFIANLHDVEIPRDFIDELTVWKTISPDEIKFSENFDYLAISSGGIFSNVEPLQLFPLYWNSECSVIIIDE